MSGVFSPQRAAWSGAHRGVGEALYELPRVDRLHTEQHRYTPTHRLGHLGLRGQPWLTTCRLRPTAAGGGAGPVSTAGARTRTHRRGAAPPDGLCPGAQPLHEPLLNFAISFTIISILSGCLTLYYFGLQHGGPPIMLWGWLLVGGLVLFGGPVDGRDLLGVPDGRRPLLLGGQARARQQRPDLVVVHRLVQPARPGRRHGRHQLRLRLLGLGLPRHLYTNKPYWTSPGHVIAILAVILVRPGPAQHLQHPTRRPAERRLGLLAPHRRAPSSSSCCSGRRPRTPTSPPGFLFGSTGWDAFVGPVGLLAPLLHLPGRPAERAVHLHRLRRLGPRL